jgi:hypothetical protein
LPGCKNKMQRIPIIQRGPTQIHSPCDCSLALFCDLKYHNYSSGNCNLMTK